MIQINDKSQCTGCTACQQICTHKAIDIKFDAEGHTYPIVNTSKCVDCGLCDKVCPMLNKERIPTDNNLDSLPVYAVYNKDEDIRKRSTSGGVFSLMAEYIISCGGVVYAARFDENYHIIHSRFDDLSELDAYRGSKYAQSELGDTFRQIRQDLKTRKVLFVGTPCQVAGLKGFLIKEYNNLYTCDFICMGISSPVIWEEYLKEFWKGRKIEKIFFKDKRDGWHQWKMLIQYDGGKEYLIPGMNDPYFYLYLTHLSYRPSCFGCPFRTCKRLSDFTIADCWGVDKCIPEFDDNRGCTTLILQTQKAESVYNEITHNLYTALYSITDVQAYNPYITRQIDINPERQSFIELYSKRGFKTAVRKYKHKENNRLLQSIKRGIKKIIKK